MADMKKWEDNKSEEHKKQLIASIGLCISKNHEYWQRVEKQQREITSALGGPQWNTRRESLLTKPLEARATDAEVYNAVMQLMRMSLEIYKLEFAEQGNFMRAAVAGKSRYGSQSQGQLDLTVGYAI
jgi:hypothetical protein